MSDPISVCLIGCGAVSRSFYAAALSTPSAKQHFRVDWLVDPSEPARNVLLQRFPKAQGVASLTEARCPPDSLAIVATPPGLHVRQSLECFQRGWHVLCEKPMASSGVQCSVMMEAAAAADRLLAVGLYKRFFPSAGMIRQLVIDQSLGRPLHYSVVEGGPFDWPAASPSFFNKQQTSGGVLLDIGVHVLDLLLWWFGDPQALAYADDAMGGLEANCRLRLDYANGMRGTVRLSRDWRTSNEYRIRFEKGSIVWRVNDANGLTLDLDGLPGVLRSHLIERTETPLESPLQPSNPQSFTLQMLNVAAAIRGHATLLVDGHQGARSIALIERCYQRRQLLDQPWMDPSETLAAQKLAHVASSES